MAVTARHSPCPPRAALVCRHRAGWVRALLLEGDQLASLARRIRMAGVSASGQPKTRRTRPARAASLAQRPQLWRLAWGARAQTRPVPVAETAADRKRKPGCVSPCDVLVVYRARMEGLPATWECDRVRSGIPRCALAAGARQSHLRLRSPPHRPRSRCAQEAMTCTRPDLLRARRHGLMAWPLRPARSQLGRRAVIERTGQAHRRARQTLAGAGAVEHVSLPHLLEADRILGTPERARRARGCCARCSAA